MSRFRPVSEPTILPVASPGAAETLKLSVRESSELSVRESSEADGSSGGPPRATLTGAIGALCMYPLRAIIRACVALGIHPNLLTLTGVIINVGAAWALGYGRFMRAFVIMLVANIFDFIDGKVAHQLKLQSRFGAFWDSTLDRFSDLALLTGLIFLYSKLGRSDYVMVAALALIFSIMTSYARARAESLVEKCKVGFMERPERIVLFMIGALTNRMAAVLWVILTLSILAVANRIYYTYLALNELPMPAKSGLTGILNRAFFWTDERATIPYDLWVIAILAFVWLTPPDWLGDPTAGGPGLLGWINSQFTIHN
jgi:CDP-diacylglycerol--glycerol-3-phosphate 3-phosphatidyltransferase